ncbi:ABC transporter ATP-binding protein [Natrialba sp. PRR66]|uniref:ABC transporter ATP-binding protein n=1 Tax=Natrialba sp. PRR66 TaxID=3098146 RepID=UPI002B1E5160|nr:ABC transporter ATP-binding protein [Natrialba sp. PRR66]
MSEHTTKLGTDAAAKPVLQVRGLRTHYDTINGTVKAVNGIDFDVNEGETLCLVGESGCGKSTVALSLLDLVPSPGEVVDGKVHFDDDDLLDLPHNALRDIRGDRIAITYQDALTSLNPVLKNGKQIDEPQLSHHDISKQEARRRSIETLKDLHIQDPEGFVDSYPHEASGGMRQRGLLSIGLVMQPELLIADEPTSALDVTTQARVLELMKDLQDEYNMSMILITHNLGVVAEMADRVAIMYAGNIVEIGDVHTIFNNPAHPYTKLLLEAIPDPHQEEALQDIEGSVPNLSDPPSGCRFHPRCPYATAECTMEQPPEETLEDDHMVVCYHSESVREDNDVEE